MRNKKKEPLQAQGSAGTGQQPGPDSGGAGGTGWGILSTHRKALLGFSAILVVLYHFTADLSYSSLPRTVRSAAHWLYACAVPFGVAAFLFLSGFGLYFSLQRCTSLRTFYRSRYLPLLTAYLLWGLVYWPVADLVIWHSTLRRMLADFSLITFWIWGDHAFWYVAVVIVFFLVYPLLFRALRGENRLRYLNYCLLLALDAALCLFLKRCFPTCYDNIEICLLRFPVFLTGTLLGDKIYRRARFSKPDLLLMAGILLCKLAVVIRYTFWGYNVWVYQRVLNDHFSVVILVLFAVLLEKCRLPRLKRLLEAIAPFSLELYLTHLSIWNLVGHFGIYGPQYFALELTAAVLLSILLHKAVLLVQARLFRAGSGRVPRAES